MNKTSEVKSELLPIYIVKRDSHNTKTLSREKVNFKVNYGNVYHINYKYFTPKGFHVADDSTRNVTCRYTDNGLNLSSITFSYVQGAKKMTARPIRVNYIDIATNKRVLTGLATGRYGQSIDVSKQVLIPKGYILCPNQKTAFSVNQYNQSIDIMVETKPAESKHASKDNVKSAESLRNKFTHRDEALKKELRQYNYRLSAELIYEILHHDLNLFKFIVMKIFTRMDYEDVDGLNITPSEHKISGVIKKRRNDDNRINFTLVRAKYCDIHNRIQISNVRDFVTSVDDHNCSKGVFITTSDFTPEAEKEAKRHSIILINNVRLAHLMIDNDVGIKTRQNLKIVDLDKNFFRQA